MKTETATNFKTYIFSLVIAGLLAVASLFAFKYIGNALLQIFLSVAMSLAVCVAVCRQKNSQTVVGLALLIFVMFWLFTALIIQLRLQIEAGWVLKWIFEFYFDKLLVVGAEWLTCTLFFLIKRLFDEEPNKKYRDFFQYSSIAFGIFYTFLLLFSFVFIRVGVNENNVYPLNLSLLATTKMYFANWSAMPYEMFMMLCGNLFYFTPLGYIFCVKMRGKKNGIKLAVLIVFPLLAFSLLEFSQYLLQIGYCEIDDMLMNAVGFWLGAALYPLSNRFARAVSKQRVNSFWA